MGMGYTFRCCGCGYELEAYMGGGFLLPSVTEKTIQELKSGKYGETAKIFFEENPDGTADCRNELFRCKKCGFLKVDMSLDLYKRKEGVSEPDYLFPDEDHFCKSMKLDHICERCGSKMKKQKEARFLKDIENGKIRCPDCGGYLELAGFFNWD